VGGRSTRAAGPSSELRDRHAQATDATGADDIRLLHVTKPKIESIRWAHASPQLLRANRSNAQATQAMAQGRSFDPAADCRAAQGERRACSLPDESLSDKSLSALHESVCPQNVQHTRSRNGVSRHSNLPIFVSDFTNTFRPKK
jgi:hypothetical protein